MVSSNQDSQADSVDRYYLQEAGSAGPDGKFLVNERIEEDDTAASSKSKTRKEHYCSDCNKCFSSGKALGGHMSSAHVQAGKDYQSKKLRLKNSSKFKNHLGGSADIGIEDGGKKVLCEICGKDFPSQKSLYGHMRCHPDRDYRGMQPPETNNTLPFFLSDHVYEYQREEIDKEASPFAENNSPFLSSDYEDELLDDTFYDPVNPVVVKLPVIDLAKFLTSWGVTGKRGRQGKNPSPLNLSVSSAESEGLDEAAYSLVNLGNGTLSIDKESEEVEDMSSNSIEAEIEDVKLMEFFQKKKQRKAGFYQTSKSKRQKLLVSPSRDKRRFSPVKKLTIGERKLETRILLPASCKGKGKTPMEYEDDDSDSERTPEQENEKYIGPLKPMVIEAEKYKCSTCNKTFTTHQALGGHRSSHNKSRVSIQNYINDDSSRENQSISRIVEAKEGSCTPGRTCPICPKTFSSGKALGGHMRCHATALSSPAATLTEEGEDIHSGRKGKDFDLNKLPDEMG